MKKQFKLIILLLLCVAFCVKAQDKIIKIWPDGIPGAVADSSYKEIADTSSYGMISLSNVKEPTIAVFLAKNVKSDSSAVIICPGGGYQHLAYTKEGVKVANWLNSLGISAFVLKYRLPNDKIMKDKKIGPLQDAQEAMRIVRRNAKEWKINPNKIGIMGFSAGGHLASTLCTHYNMKVYNSDNTSARPDFSILLYPVISMKAKITHMGSRTNLLGQNSGQKLIQKFSNELQVNKNTPPAFLALAANDRTVPVENSIDYFLALKKYNIPAELHIYEKGGHGFGLGHEGETNSNWPKACENWLKQIGM